MGKLLLETCLEMYRCGAVVSVQDMGAAGLTCSSTEMALKGGVGMELELDRVPQRAQAMTPYEIMLSESQERMLLVAEAGREEEIFTIICAIDSSGKCHQHRLHLFYDVLKLLVL